MSFKVGDLVIPRAGMNYYSVAKYRCKYIGKITNLNRHGRTGIKCISHENPQNIGFHSHYNLNDFMSINEAVKQGCFYGQQEPTTFVEPISRIQQFVDRAITNLEESLLTEPRITLHHTISTPFSVLDDDIQSEYIPF